jgi:2-keto-4-pentenoate hydratase/2-oxohepta-3-ene-1,7-dioic acid hydratase in catechol pathway
MTLEPGDIVSSGTPGGTAMFQDPPAFLTPGDTVALEIDGIGRLENTVADATVARAQVAEPPA